jgi:hypothetical protein
VHVKNLLKNTNGSAAGCPPRNISIIKFDTKNQKNIWYKREIVVGIDIGLTLKNGIINKIKIAANILTTPPNLFGQARKIA